MVYLKLTCRAILSDYYINSNTLKVSTLQQTAHDSYEC